MVAGTTYYYYTINANDINRTYTIEFTAGSDEDTEEILNRVTTIAKSAFAELNREKENIKEKISEYVENVRNKIKRNPSLGQGEFLELLSHLVDYEEAENNRFKKDVRLEEVKKLSTFMQKDPLPKLEHTDTSDSWSHTTYLGRKDSSNTILLQVFDKSLLCELEIDATTLEPRYASCSSSFTITSFDKYLSGLQ